MLIIVYSILFIHLNYPVSKIITSLLRGENFCICMQQTDDILALRVLRITSTTEVLSYTATMYIKGNKPFDWFFQLLTCMYQLENWSKPLERAP